jgi:hypothetical protein
MKHSIPILSCVLAAGLFFACKPDATPKAKEAEAWLNTFYTRYTIRGGWGFFGAQAKDKNVMIEINVPERQAHELMGKFTEADRKAFIARNVCPPQREPIWSMLDQGGDLIIHTRLNGNVFAEVSCNENVKGS